MAHQRVQIHRLRQRVIKLQKNKTDHRNVLMSHKFDQVLEKQLSAFSAGQMRLSKYKKWGIYVLVPNCVAVHWFSWWRVCVLNESSLLAPFSSIMPHLLRSSGHLC